MYQVILIYDETKERSYYYSYVESTDKTLGNIETDDLPAYQDINKARSCYLADGTWIFDSEKYVSICNEIDQQAKDNLTTVSDSEKLSLFASLIQVDDAPSENGIVLPKKTGYIWKKQIALIDGVYHISWVLVKDDTYVNDKDGSDYLKAIDWTEGMIVTEGLWYNVGDNVIWQAKKTGIPESGEDTEFFDIP